MTTHYFGIRHHGPGSARSVLHALQALKPDVVLVEGPPDADALLPMLKAALMIPPVALLIYVENDPAQAVYYPFVHFSPEYQAIRYALGQSIPVRFIDLPQRFAFGLRAALDQAVKPAADNQQGDPLSALARVAGYDDAERWWDSLIEQGPTTQDQLALFAAIHEAMSALRAETPIRDPLESFREAYMRQQINRAQTEGFARIAVVCGAWHTPGLHEIPYSEEDAQNLARLGAQTVAATWVPWTYSRLSRESGYGAGVRAPGWYRFLWENADPKMLAIGWLTSVAQHLRKQNLDASTAQVIDAVHLVETLTRMRSRALPDLQDLNEAALSVLCHGNDVLMRIIERDLTIGSALGRVPADAPMVPLERDFNDLLERFSLTLSDEPSLHSLDLRADIERETSAFLNRLLLLEVPWGECIEAVLVYEDWELRWDPAYRVTLIEKSIWGNSILQAATAFALHVAQHTPSLPELTALVQRILQAEVPNAIPEVMRLLENSAATTGDIAALMTALPPLANILAYGDARRTPSEAIQRIVDGLAARIMLGLPAECTGLDDDRAAKMLDSVIACNAALRLLNHPTRLEAWHQLLIQLVEGATIHGLLRGRFCRVVLDAGVIDKPRAVTLMRLALARIVSPVEAAAWLTGFLRDSGIILVHDDVLLEAMDEWVTGLSVDDFEDILPLIRRTVASFEEPEINDIGKRISRKTRVRRQAPENPLNMERARQVDSTLDDLLGLKGTP